MTYLDIVIWVVLTGMLVVGFTLMFRRKMKQRGSKHKEEEETYKRYNTHEYVPQTEHKQREKKVNERSTDYTDMNVGVDHNGRIYPCEFGKPITKKVFITNKGIRAYHVNDRNLPMSNTYVERCVSISDTQDG
jgi:hypothetical protein